MNFQTYNLPYNPDWLGNQGNYTVEIQTTNMGLGAGWTFIDLDNEENAASTVFVDGYTTITQFLQDRASVELTIPEIICIFYNVKKFKLVSSLGNKTFNTFISESLGNTESIISNIYQYVCGPIGRSDPSVWLGRTAYTHSIHSNSDNINFYMRPIFYIYKNKYYMGVYYLQPYQVTISNNVYFGQIGLYSLSNWPNKVECGNLTILNKNVPLYNLNPNENNRVTCNVILTPIEYWTY